LDFEEQDLCQCCTLTVEEIIRRSFRVDIHKALNPLNDDDFIVIVGRLTRALVKSTKEDEGKALKAAIQALDVNWKNMTGTDRDRIIDASRIAIRNIPKKLIRPVKQELTIAGPRVVKGSRKGTKARLPIKLSNQIGVDMSLKDTRMTDWLVNSQSLFIRDEYGRRSARFSVLAREIVTEGLDSGLGRDSIAENLENRLMAAIGLEKSKSYWNMISGVFVNRARTWGQMASFQEAGIERMTFLAVMDEVTTEQCRALHGKTFDVSEGVRRYEETEASQDPEAVKDLTPWIHTGKDGHGNKVLYVKDRGGRRTIVGTVVKSGVGKKDEKGKFKGLFSSKQLQAIGAFLPPLHSRCRSTIDADV
jgi:SPP1 gp7 family putative phage head morphogenesis protein